MLAELQKEGERVAMVITYGLLPRWNSVETERRFLGYALINWWERLSCHRLLKVVQVRSGFDEGETI
jgi:hypothetical protein